MYGVEGTAYSFEYRVYDSRIGRWLSTDPLTAQAPSWTPYRAFFNNPNYWSDIDGRIEWPLKGSTAINKKDAKNGGWGLKNTVVRTSTYRDTDRPPGATNPHIGIDYRAVVGTPFYSLGDGEVVDIGSTRKGAKYIKVQYSNGDVVRFLHINSVAEGLAEGSLVKEGQILGETGSTGTKQPHLHVDAVDKDGREIDPEATQYGRLTNKQFFEEYGGDYTKVPTVNIAEQNKSIEEKNKTQEVDPVVTPSKQNESSGKSFWGTIKQAYNEVIEGIKQAITPPSTAPY